MFDHNESHQLVSKGDTSPFPPPWLTLLGPPALSVGSRKKIRLERKSAGLLGYLAMEGETPRSRLATMLWPAAGESTARNNLAQALRRIKQAASSIPLVNGQAHLSLVPTVSSDIRDLITCMAGPSVGKDAETINFGEFLEGLDYEDCPEFDDWLQIQRESLNARRLAALESLAEDAEAGGDLRAALSYANRLLAIDPYCEAHYRRLMRLLWLNGDRNAALTIYRRCRESLHRELGIQPSAETLALERSILRGDAPVLPQASCRPLPPTLLRPPRLVEREALLARMEAAWDNGQSVFIEGHHGYGKSRLMQEFLSRKGRFYTFHGSPGDRNIPYATIARQTRSILKAFPAVRLPDWVRQELAPILPELGDGAGLRSRPDRLRIVLALAEVHRLAVEGGMRRVAFDDLHLADTASICAALFVGSRLREGSHAVQAVFCLRCGELPPRARHLISQVLESGRAILIRLPLLSEEALAGMLAGIDESLVSLARPLHRHAGGNPLFALETLRAMHGSQSLNGGSDTWPPSGNLPVPRKIRDALRHRLGRLSPEALLLARLAALAGDAPGPSLAEQRLPIPKHQVADAWAELAAADILVEWRFANEVSRQVILDDLPEPLRDHLTRDLSPARAEGGR